MKTKPSRPVSSAPMPAGAGTDPVDDIRSVVGGPADGFKKINMKAGLGTFASRVSPRKCLWTCGSPPK